MAIIEGTLTTYDTDASIREDFRGGIYVASTDDPTLGPTAPVLGVSGSPLIYTAVYLNGNPELQAVLLYNLTNGTLAGPTQGTIMYGTGSGWLSTNVTGSGNLYTVTVAADTTAPPLLPGLYDAVVPFVDAVGGGVVVSVTLTVFVAAPLLTPGAGALVLEGLAPTVIATTTSPLVEPGVGALVLEGLRPSVIRSEASPQARPGIGVLTLAGLAPTISVVQTSPVVTPGVGALTLTGLAPVAYTGAAEATVTPGVGALTLTGLAPTVLSAPQAPFLPPLAILPTWSTFDTSTGNIDGEPFTPEALGYFS